ncbi:Bgr_08870 family protein, partial [Bartonella refiksaydamii]|uniref:Bgr_08870 family protein n=1 Tax=Bartonella refiksaydamii TaxID=2654951 RepID=UPI0018DD8C50
SSNNNFTFGSAVSLLGAHQHKTEDIVGLDDFRAKINKDLTSYGRLASSNEWQNYNKFTSKVTMGGGLELLGNSSLSLTHNGEVVTNLSTTGSTLKGPLKIDGEAVYTKAQVDKLITEVDKLITSLTKKPVEILITESGTIPLPEGFSDDTDVEIWAWGGGGGGGGDGGNNDGGGGGGGGQYARVKIKGSQLRNSRIAQIAQGGIGGNNNAGNGGGATIIKGIIFAAGGGGGNSKGRIGGAGSSRGECIYSMGGLGDNGRGGDGGENGNTFGDGCSFVFSGGKGGFGGSNLGGSSVFGGGGGGGGAATGNGRGGYGGGSDKGGTGGKGSKAGGGGGGGGYFPGKDGSKAGGAGGNGAILLRFFI